MNKGENGSGQLSQETLEALAIRAVEGYRQEQQALRKRRQAEGIAAAKARGVRFGRPEIRTPDNFAEIVRAWERKLLPLETVLQLCGMSESAFFRRLKRYRQECGIKK